MTAAAVLPNDLLPDPLARYSTDNIRARIAGRRVLLVGTGDLARKKEPWVRALHDLGVDVYLIDTNKQPVALDALGPYAKEFLCLQDRGAEKKMVELGRKDRYFVVDIATFGPSHLSTAMRLQDSTEWIVNTKPVDTHLDLVRTIGRSSGDPLFGNLIERALIHDHYGARWVVRAAAEYMPEWLRANGFVTEIQIFILEHRSVNQEMHRLTALQDGICLDLMPHAFRVIEALMPVGQQWEGNGFKCRRHAVELEVVGGAREHNLGCAIPGMVETFAAVSLEGHDVVQLGDTNQPARFPFRCLVVVGKGIGANSGDERDTKGVSVGFQSGSHASLDLESQRIQFPDGSVLNPPMDVLHRGINWPLLELTAANTEDGTLPADVRSFFQPMTAACAGMELIVNARRLQWLGMAYSSTWGCVDLINRIPHDWWGKTPWQLRHFPHVQIGQPPRNVQIIA